MAPSRLFPERQDEAKDLPTNLIGIGGRKRGDTICTGQVLFRFESCDRKLNLSALIVPGKTDGVKIRDFVVICRIIVDGSAQRQSSGMLSDTFFFYLITLSYFILGVM